ncbi:MAG: peptide chain release factor 1 [Puniceicoccaceae bacterium]|nr:MAG: peptide chain release factor 1 [Puniceicoccaceae bacterium]
MAKLPEIGPFVARLEELDAQMASPDFYADARRSAAVSREHTRLTELVAAHAAHRRLEKDLAETRSLVKDAAAEKELRELAEAELPELEARIVASLKQLLLRMLPPEETDSRNTIMEIRAGAGGEEASLFAADLHRMYVRYAEAKGWKVELLSASLSERGGYKEVIFSMTGEEVYRLMKFESGVHRVQRVPDTEASGRIHTSTVTVAVLPEAEEVDVEIDPGELEITVSRASGPGGQGVNTTDSAVQILHRPTGLIVSCAEERSQIKNKARAMTVLRSRLLQRKQEEERARYAQNRRSQIGTGDRSERIRTYNYSQTRVTDHRIGLTLHSLPAILEGDLDPVVEALQEADREARLEALLKGVGEPAAAEGGRGPGR